VTRIRTVAEEIAHAIELDLNDRRGLHLDNLDKEILQEIRSDWRRKIEAIIKNRLRPYDLLGL
jgi:hypothetical protein